MFERLHPVAAVLERARDEAAVLGSQDLEAEHLLLALTAEDDPAVRAPLSEAGLDRDAVRRALMAQDEAALAIAGVSRSAFGLSETRPLFSTPGWGTSSKQAIIRAHDVAKHHGDSRMRAGHLLLGVLGAEHGTVPRLLSFAGVDQAQLAESTRAAVDAARRP